MPCAAINAVQGRSYFLPLVLISASPSFFRAGFLPVRMGHCQPSSEDFAPPGARLHFLGLTLEPRAAALCKQVTPRACGTGAALLT